MGPDPSRRSVWSWRRGAPMYYCSAVTTRRRKSSRAFSRRRRSCLISFLQRVGTHPRKTQALDMCRQRRQDPCGPKANGSCFMTNREVWRSGVRPEPKDIQALDNFPAGDFAVSMATHGELFQCIPIYTKQAAQRCRMNPQPTDQINKNS